MTDDAPRHDDVSRAPASLYDRSPLLQTLFAIAHGVANPRQSIGRRKYGRQPPAWVRLSILLTFVVVFVVLAWLA